MPRPYHANATLSPDVLERALHATGIMIVLTDPRLDDNPIVWVNDYFCEFTGYDRADVLGRNCRFLQGDACDEAGIARIRRAVEASEAVHVLLTNYKADGTPFENDLYVSPVRTEGRTDGVPRYYIGVQNDSTARVRAERAVREREREIDETAENERERFGMDLHDGLGQELAGARLLARALADGLAAEGSVHAEAAADIVGIIGAALNSARDMAQGLNPVDASQHGLGDALSDLCAAADRASPGVAVRARVEAVAFDDRREARHLYRIAQEALSNAVKHAHATEIAVTLHRAPTSVHLEVRDDGAGIAPDVLAAERDESARAEPSRRGMGLYGMRHRADLIGALLTIATGEDGGTVVRCVLPVSAFTPDAQHDRHGERE